MKIDRHRFVMQTLGATALFTLLTIAMTWPQATVLVTHARDHHDVYFNMWRLAWVSHALTTAPHDLFNGNIFFPEPRALTYSDAMIVEGLFATPLLVLGAPPVLVHNLLLLGAIIASATGVFVLARYLTGSAAAGSVAGIVFAFVPYRFEHYMHMEMQWTVWMPWAFWSLHRTLDSGRWKYSLLTGLFVSLQMLSSIYYGVFLIVLLGVFTLVQLLAMQVRSLPTTVARLIPAAIVTAILCGAYSIPYLETKKDVGGRAEREIMQYSARPSSYLVATPDNVLYGHVFASRGRPERRLFPGTLVVLLAIVGLFTRPERRAVATIGYLLAMVLAYEMSLGISGYSYRFLLDNVPVFQGFRAVARLGIFVVFFLTVLGAFGFRALGAGRRLFVRRLLLAAAVVILVVEYRVRPLHLMPYENEAPSLHAWLATQPRGVVAELPMRDDVPGSDPRTSYLSTFHWQPIVNGYSGFVPQSYLDRLYDLRNFPDDESIHRLRKDGVRYVVVHLWEYPKDEAVLVVQALTFRHGLPELKRFYGRYTEIRVYLLRS
jgi:hypothetical protein